MRDAITILFNGFAACFFVAAGNIYAALMVGVAMIYAFQAIYWERKAKGE